MGIKQSMRRAGLAFAVFLVSAGMAAGAGLKYVSNGMANASPAEVYLRYIEVLHNAQSLPEIFPFSPNPKAQNMKDLETLSPEQRKQGLAGIKAMSLNPEGAKILSQKITGDTAILEVRGLSPGMNGKLEATWATVKMIRRQGEWKILSQALRDTEKPSNN